MILICIPFAFCLFILAISTKASDVQESVTKHTFPGVLKGLKLAGVGARIKKIGPIKATVYAAGLYLDKDSCSKALISLKNKSLKEFGNSEDLENVLMSGKFGKRIILKMARSVGSSKMVDALAESVQPRMNGQDSASLNSFKDILSKELDTVGGAKVNTEFSFESLKTGQLRVEINGSFKGSIQSSALCNALIGVYVDKSAVSGSLRSSVHKTLFSWVSGK